MTQERLKGLVEKVLYAAATIREVFRKKEIEMKEGYNDNNSSVVALVIYGLSGLHAVVLRFFGM